MQDDLPKGILYIISPTSSALYKARQSIPRSRNSYVKGNFGGHHSAGHTDLRELVQAWSGSDSHEGMGHHPHLVSGLSALTYVSNYRDLGLANGGREAALACATLQKLEGSDSNCGECN